MMQIEGDEQCADILRLHSASDLMAGETNFRSDLNNILRLDSAPEQFGENDESPDTAAPAEEGADGPSDIMRIHTSEEGTLSPLLFCVALTYRLPERRCMFRSQLFFSQHSSVCLCDPDSLFVCLCDPLSISVCCATHSRFFL